MIPDEEAKALFLDWIEKLHEVVKAGTWHVVKAGKVSGSDATEVEAFIREIDGLRIVSHADPKGIRLTFDFRNDFPKGVHLAPFGPDVNVPDGVEGEDIGPTGMDRLN